MKKLLPLILAFGFCAAGYAQTPGQTFLSTLAQYFTSFNTNLTTFQNSKFELSNGPIYQDNVSIADSLIFAVNVKKGGGLYLESETRTAPVANGLVSQTLGAGYGFVKYDTKLSGGINGGYAFDSGRPLLGVYADLRKAITPNTYSGVRIGYQTDFSRTPTTPTILGFVGFVW